MLPSVTESKSFWKDIKNLAWVIKHFLSVFIETPSTVSTKQLLLLQDNVLDT